MVHHKKRSRKYVCVVHNITPGHKDDIIRKIGETYPLLYYCLGEEEYTETPGEYHLHLQLQFKNQISKSNLLKKLEDIVPRDTSLNEQTSTHRGRVQADPMYGTIQEATQYLIDPKKNKHVDNMPNLSNYPTDKEYIYFPKGSDAPLYIVNYHVQKFHEQMPYIELDVLQKLFYPNQNYEVAYLNPHYIKPKKKKVKDKKPVQIDWAKHAARPVGLPAGLIL